jgi:hypothetical protein
MRMGVSTVGVVGALAGGDGPVSLVLAAYMFDGAYDNLPFPCVLRPSARLLKRVETVVEVVDNLDNCP